MAKKLEVEVEGDFERGGCFMVTCHAGRAPASDVLSHAPSSQPALTALPLETLHWAFA